MKRSHTSDKTVAIQIYVICHKVQRLKGKILIRRIAYDVDLEIIHRVYKLTQKHDKYQHVKLSLMPNLASQLVCQEKIWKGNLQKEKEKNKFLFLF